MVAYNLNPLIGSDDRLVVTIGHLNRPTEIVGFSDTHQDSILVTFPIILKPNVGLAEAVIGAVMRPVRKAAVTGGSAA